MDFGPESIYQSDPQTQVYLRVLKPRTNNSPRISYADLSAIQNYGETCSNYNVLVSTAKVLSTLDRTSRLAAQS